MMYDLYVVLHPEVMSKDFEMRHKPTGMSLGNKFEPTAFKHDFLENSVTWRFDTSQEAEEFVKAVNEMMKGISK